MPVSSEESWARPSRSASSLSAAFSRRAPRFAGGNAGPFGEGAMGDLHRAIHIVGAAAQRGADDLAIAGVLDIERLLRKRRSEPAVEHNEAGKALRLTLHRFHALRDRINQPRRGHVQAFSISFAARVVGDVVHTYAL